MTYSQPEQDYQEIQARMLQTAYLPWILMGLTLWFLDLQPPSLWPFLAGLVILTLVGATVSVADSQHTLAAICFCAAQVAAIALLWRIFPHLPWSVALVVPCITAGLVLTPWAPLVGAAVASILLVWFPQWLAPHALGNEHWVSLWVIWAVALLCWASQREHRDEVIRSREASMNHLENLAKLRDQQLELRQAVADLEHATTETIRMNNQLLAARRAVQEAQQSKENFVANVSHELRTPLNMIIGFSELILEAPEAYADSLPPTLLADISAIKRNSEHLSQLVNDVLALAESEADSMRLSMEVSDIGSIAREAAEAVQVLIQQKRLCLTLDIPDDLPSVYCDRTRIRQVILNIVGNAARFTEKGGMTLEATAGDGVIQLSVRDTGPGISKEQVNRVFEPFWQGDPSVRRRYGGTGLGLAISRRFVELHKGEIWIESQMDVGTTVSFTLPTADTAQMEQDTRWYSVHGQLVPGAVERHAPAVSSQPALVVVESEPALSVLFSRLDSDHEYLTSPSLALARTEASRLGAQGIIVTDGDLAREALDDSTGSSQDAMASLDVPIFRCNLPDQREILDRYSVQGILTKPIKHQALIKCIDRFVPPGGTLLIVDDDDQVRHLFSRMAQTAEQGLVLIDAEDGRAALEIMDKSAPDLVLLDLLMPTMDGFAVLDERAKRPGLKEIPVIVTSAHDLAKLPMVSDNLVVSRGSGLSPRDLVDAISAVGSTLGSKYRRLAPPEKRDDS